MKRTPFYRRPGRTGQFSGLRERVIWMIQTRGRPVTGSEIAEKFGVTLIEFNRVANGITRGTGQIAQIVESKKWLNEDGICDRTFDLVTKPKVVPQLRLKSFSVTLPFPLTASTATPYQLSVVKNATNQYPSRGALLFPAVRRVQSANLF